MLKWGLPLDTKNPPHADGGRVLVYFYNDEVSWNVWLVGDHITHASVTNGVPPWGVDGFGYNTTVLGIDHLTVTDV